MPVRSWLTAVEPLLEQLPHQRRVGRALRLAHRRAEQHAEELLLAGAVALHLRPLRAERARDGALDGAAVLHLLEPQLLHARLGLAALLDERGEQRLPRRGRDAARVGERDEAAERR